MSSTSSASATGSFSAGGGNLKIVGIILAITSGLLIGSSFVFKKKGLLRSQAGHAAGEGVAYLKSPLWWTGMIMMILGELCNFAAYAFVEAIVVTPLGALSVVICAILSSFFLNEKLSFFGWLGCGLCIIGSVIIALNGPSEQSVGQITEFQKLFLAPGFLVYGSVLIAAALVIIFYFGPRYGKKSMLWWIFVCSMIGGISVSVTTGLGAAIVTTAQGDNQFKHWFIYFLMAFVAVTLITEVYYLNVALALFNTAMVTPTYYVIFTFFSIVTTIVLFQGLKASATSIITLVMGFLVICFGITILQMSKVDPEELSSKLDRRSTILLQAARQQTENEEKSMLGMEDPGMDALRGSLHGTVGSIMRARRISQSSRAGSMYRSRHGSNPPPWSHTGNDSTDLGPGGLTRHQLYDAPMPSPAFSSTTAATRGDLDASSMRSSSFISNTGGAQLPVKKPTIKFGSQDMVHSYHPTNAAAGQDLGATHERRPVPIERGSSDRGLGAPGAVMHGGGGGGGYPPVRTDLTGDSQTMSQLLSAIQESPASDGLPGENNALIFGTRLGDEQTVHSAPPTVAGKFPRGVPARKDSRDVFEGSPISTTMMTFPSVTDSARSWDEQAEEDGRKGNHDTRGRSAKRYPKGAEDQDREESVSLWRRDGKEPEETTDEEGFSPSSPEDYRLTQMGGVRLVGSGSRIP
ncbi:DUF803-domain-containing protein [Dendrothele bispora CBS 962.96]|uniref:DUF803-domain-containing protein n=1 Tax=Dendrothele bispora (strain CBS 962.96) TaxID=1314807 RepID=A0A4S8L4Z0_DENBC|nr:DUF803-domain-containing protein [Dendrothele bispora CBS 962.96]